MAAPFGVMYFLTCQKIKKKYGINILIYPAMTLRIAFGKNVEGLPDDENQADLKRIRIGVWGWNIALLPVFIIWAVVFADMFM